MLSSMGGTCASWLQWHLESVPSVSNLMREKQSCCMTHKLWHLSLHSWHPWGTHALVFTFRDQGHTSLLWPVLSLSHLIILCDLSVTFPLRVCWRVSIHWQSPPILPDFQDCLKSADPSLLQVPRLRIFNLKIALCRRTDNILSLINFPKLRTLSIRSFSHVTISIKVAFFKQHSLVKMVFLFSNPFNGLTPTTPKSVLSLPPLTHLFLSANYHLLKLKDASFLQECFLQAPNLRPGPLQVKFCLNMNTLLAVLASLTKYKFNNLKLIISLPSCIPDHIEHFLIYREVQCLCRKPDALHLSGVKKMEFMVNSFDCTVAVSSISFIGWSITYIFLRATLPTGFKSALTFLNFTSNCNFIASWTVKQS